MLGKTLALIAALAPAAAHCRCEREHHRHHEARGHVRHVAHVLARGGDWDTARFEVTAGRPCGNYPASALAAHASGVTWVKLRVDPDGFVEAGRVSRGSGRADLDRAALACVAGWRLGAGYEWRVARVAWRFRWVPFG